jgi:hypothetical protein
MSPWETIEDPEVRLYMDEAMFFMVVIGGMDPFRAWAMLDRLRPRSPPGTLSYDLFFHDGPYDLAMFLVHGDGWWRLPGAETRPRNSYERYQQDQKNGSWQTLKQTHFHD